MRSFLARRAWLLDTVVLSLLLAAQTHGLFTRTEALTGGAVPYPLDDAYIHLAVARTLAEHGVWGLRPDHFAACTSSLLWPLALAAARLLGETSWAPVTLSSAAATAAVALACGALRDEAGLLRRGAVAVLAFAAPLGPLTAMGMEHAPQVLASLALVHAASGGLGATAPSRRQWAELAALAFLATSLRYEGAFLVAALCGALALRRRWLGALAVGAVGALPPVLFGAYALAHGGPFFPSSVLLKRAPLPLGSLGGWLEVFGRIAEGLRAVPSLAFLLAAVLLGWVATSRSRSTDAQALRAIQAVYLATAVLHLVLARVGHWFRYEAYLVALGVYVLARTLGRLARQPAVAERLALARFRVAAAALAILFCVPLLIRGATADRAVPYASRNVYAQQFQMARLALAFGREAVALNDIGAVAYFTDVEIVDLWGLASPEVMRAKREGRDDADFNAQQVARAGAPVAMLYADWYPDTLPSAWTRVGSWRVRNAGALGNAEVTVFATTPEDVPRVRSAFCGVAATFPPGVTGSTGTEACR